MAEYFWLLIGQEEIKAYALDLSKLYVLGSMVAVVRVLLVAISVAAYVQHLLSVLVTGLACLAFVASLCTVESVA